MEPTVLQIIIFTILATFFISGVLITICPGWNREGLKLFIKMNSLMFLILGGLGVIGYSVFMMGNA